MLENPKAVVEEVTVDEDDLRETPEKWDQNILLAILRRNGTVDAIVKPGIPRDVVKILWEHYRDREQMEYLFYDGLRYAEAEDRSPWPDCSDLKHWGGHYSSLKDFEAMFSSAPVNPFHTMIILAREWEWSWSFYSYQPNGATNWLPLQLLYEYPIGSPVELKLNEKTIVSGTIIGYWEIEKQILIQYRTEDGHVHTLDFRTFPVGEEEFTNYFGRLSYMLYGQDDPAYQPGQSLKAVQKKK